jgi:hypothetical protein
VADKVCQVSGIIINAIVPSELHLNQQMVDDLLQINSTTELVC